MQSRYESHSLRTNIYVTTGLQLGLILVLYSWTRFAFFFANKALFQDISTTHLLGLFSAGIRFDISAVLWTNILFILLSTIPWRLRYRPNYQRTLDWLFISLNSLGLALNCIDIVYFQYTLKRSTAAVFAEFGHETNLAALVGRLSLLYWPTTLLWIATVLAMLAIRRKIPKPREYTSPNQRTYYLRHFMGMLVVIYLAISGIRGAFISVDTRPITLSNAAEYVQKPLENAIVLNTPFAIIRTIDKQALPNYNFFSDSSSLDKLYKPTHQFQAKNDRQAKNVVIIILESFGAEWVGWLNEDLPREYAIGYTPFLDSLMRKGLGFKNAYANGRKSIDALPAITASIPSLLHPFVLSHYSTNSINSLASVLRPHGYSTHFFHGAANGSMGFSAFVNSAGFETYHGKNEYDANYPGNDKHDGYWGIWDEEFLQFTANRLAEIENPFLSVIFTLSSHSPFNVPKRYENSYPVGTQPIHKCIGYADFALKQFFETASKMPWYDNTLFVITADHAKFPTHPSYQHDMGVFKIPLLFVDPSTPSLQGVRIETAQQIDIMPSILAYLGYSTHFVAFGKNLFEPIQEPWAITYLGESYQLIGDQFVLQHNGQNPTALYNHRTDRHLKFNLIGDKPETTRNLALMTEAIIQSYSTRMRNNDLTIREDN